MNKGFRRREADCYILQMRIRATIFLWHRTSNNLDDGDRPYTRQVLGIEGFLPLLEAL